ncbi:MAG TPA: TerC family protein [Symbiobacteriaceae bacterium]|nr:TerC family protein [Symbiobacteriaceae bacterium]
MLLGNPWLLIGFNVLVLVMLALDLGVFHRKAHSVSLKEAAIWSVVWISLALAFNAGIYFLAGRELALEFLSGYLIEKALSVDNIFVFVLIFSYFKVPSQYQHRVLFWGVLGALAMRAALIAVGAALISTFHWVLYLFGAFLVYTGVKMARQKHEAADPGNTAVVRLVRRIIPVSSQYRGQAFFSLENGKRVATPLFLVLILVEVSDLIFAVDSIPAIFAVTSDPFLVYTSNVFAILGLRSLYFLLAGVVDKFRYLKLGLAAVLSFVGIKMLIVDFYKVPTPISLMVILGLIGLSIAASLLIPETKPQNEEETRAAAD